MILTTSHELRTIGRKLRHGSARIVGKCSDDKVHYFYIIEDLPERETHHVRVLDRPTWEKKYLLKEKEG
jgi:hypothetical protein